MRHLPEHVELAGGAVAGWVFLAAVELAAISAANAAYPSPRTDLLDGLYGVSSVLIGIGITLAGVAVLRARRWTGWRRALVLVTGVWVFVPMTPALLGPFVLARLAITGWMLLFPHWAGCSRGLEDDRDHAAGP